MESGAAQRVPTIASRFMQCLPEINTRYWLLLLTASVCGANLGDLASEKFGLGFIGGFLIFAVIFVGMAVASRRILFFGEAAYWAAIIVSRAAATDIADFATHQLRLSYPTLILGALAALLATVAIAARFGQTTLRTATVANGSVLVFPTANMVYWAAMILASAFGTMTGDYLADDVGLGVGRAVLLTLPAAAVAVTLRADGPPASKFFYWLVVLLVRAAATNLGDYFGGDDGLGLGFLASCAGALIVMALLTTTWPRHRAVEAR